MSKVLVLPRIIHAKLIKLHRTPSLDISIPDGAFRLGLSLVWLLCLFFDFVFISLLILRENLTFSLSDFGHQVSTKNDCIFVSIICHLAGTLLKLRSRSLVRLSHRFRLQLLFLLQGTLNLTISLILVNHRGRMYRVLRLVRVVKGTRRRKVGILDRLSFRTIANGVLRRKHV